MKKDTIKDNLEMFPPLEGPINLTGMYPMDPMGSYTGRPWDGREKPVQDADDL